MRNVIGEGGGGVVVRNRSFSNNRRMTDFFSCVRYGQLAMICGRFTCKRVRLAETKNIALLLKWRVALHAGLSLNFKFQS